MKHTKEPWNVFYDDIGYINIKDMENRYIVAEVTGNTIQQQEANAQRIVSCINACAGMEDPEKEIEKLKDDKRRLYESLRWLYHLHCDTGKSGDTPTEDEWGQCLTQAEILLEKMEAGE